MGKHVLLSKIMLQNDLDVVSKLHRMKRMKVIYAFTFITCCTSLTAVQHVVN